MDNNSHKIVTYQKRACAKQRKYHFGHLKINQYFSSLSLEMEFLACDLTINANSHREICLCHLNTENGPVSRCVCVESMHSIDLSNAWAISRADSYQFQNRKKKHYSHHTITRLAALTIQQPVCIILLTLIHYKANGFYSVIY